MEILIEFLIELFVELIGEIFFEILAAITADFFSEILADSKKRKIIKYFISSLIFIGCSVLLVLSFIYKKQLYVQLVLIYFSILLVIYIIKFYQKSLHHSYKFEKTITWINRAIHYVFPIVLIVFASINKGSESIYIIVCSSIALLVYLSINIYRLVNRKRKLTYNKFLKKNNKLINMYVTKKNKYYKYQLINLYSENKESLKKYLNECNEESFRLFINFLLHDYVIRNKDKEFIDYVDEISSRFFLMDIKKQLDEERNYIMMN